MMKRKKKDSTEQENPPGSGRPNPRRRRNPSRAAAKKAARKKVDALDEELDETCPDPRSTECPAPQSLTDASPFGQVSQAGAEVPKAGPPDLGDPALDHPRQPQAEVAQSVLAPIIVGFLPMLIDRMTPEQPVSQTELAVMEKAISDLERRYMPSAPESDTMLWIQLSAAFGLVVVPRVGPYLDRKEKERQDAEQKAKDDHGGPQGVGGAQKRGEAS